jgi:hypothetical protein
VRLSGEPSGKWVEAFRNSSEHTIACYPKMMTISPRDRLLVFEIMEDEDTTVSTWIRLIDRWIESASARVLPMQLQIGDRLVDETGTWEVASRPYTRMRGRTPTSASRRSASGCDRDPDLGRA